MSRTIGTKPTDAVTNKSVITLQKIINELRREIDLLKARLTKLGG